MGTCLVRDTQHSTLSIPSIACCRNNVIMRLYIIMSCIVRDGSSVISSNPSFL